MRRLTYKFVKKQIEKEKGYKLLSKGYINSSSKLSVQCPEGHQYEVTFDSFQQGRKCLKCGITERAKKRKLTYEYVKELIESEKGYKLLSNEYVSAHMKLDVQCSEGHIYDVSYANFQQGYRCPYCSGNKKLTIEQVKELVESEKGYKLLSKEYVNNSSKLNVQCPKGHKYVVTYASFRQKRRCPECANNQKYTYEFIKEYIKKENYKLLSDEYVNAHTKLEIQCTEGHTYKVAFNTFQQGHRCPHCSPTISKGEKEMLEFVKTLTNREVLENDRTQIINPLTGWNLELDVWIPSLKKAIEYNGEYWHSDDLIIQKDREKVKQCKEKGIDLIVIDDELWRKARILCESIIEQFIKRRRI